MKIRKATEYQTVCKGCGAQIRLSEAEVDFSRGFADQRIPCPVCGNNILVLRDGFIAEDIRPVVYDKAWSSSK